MSDQPKPDYWGNPHDAAEAAFKAGLEQGRAETAAILKKVTDWEVNETIIMPVAQLKALIPTDYAAALEERDSSQHQRDGMDAIAAILEMLKYTPPADEAIGLGTVRVALEERLNEARAEARRDEEEWWHRRWHRDTGIPCDEISPFCPAANRLAASGGERGSKK